MEESYIQLHEKHSKEHGATMSPAKIGYLDLALKSGEDKMTESLGKNAVSFVDGRATSRKNALSIKGQQGAPSLISCMDRHLQPVLRNHRHDLSR